MPRREDLTQSLAVLNQVAIPDLWQQQAVNALREGSDVVVHAPTGAGKTLIFELWSNHGKNRGQARRASRFVSHAARLVGRC